MSLAALIKPNQSFSLVKHRIDYFTEILTTFLPYKTTFV